MRRVVEQQQLALQAGISSAAVRASRTEGRGPCGVPACAFSILAFTWWRTVHTPCLDHP
jgi:hypothetical protein